VYLFARAKTIFLRDFTATKNTNFLLIYKNGTNVFISRNYMMLQPDFCPHRQNFKSENSLDENLLKHISPLGWAHINFLGEYSFNLKNIP
jgi:hypothetical protein